MMLGKRFETDFARLPSVLGQVAQNKEIVAFDIFDTIIRRRVEPEYVKDVVAQSFTSLLQRDGHQADWTFVRKLRFDLEVRLGRESEALGHDHEFLFDDLIDRWVTEVTGREKAHLYADHLKRLEIELEKKAQALTPGIEDLLDALRQQGKMLYFISDMYFSIDVIWDFLKEQNVAHFFAKGYCSSQTMRKKSTGRLFDLFLSAEGIDPSRMVFLGDNPYSDVEMPRQYGIDCIHLVDPQERKRRTKLQIAEWSSKRRNFWKGALVKEIIEGMPRHIQANDNPHYGLGLQMAPILILFVENIVERCKAEGIGKLLFLAREGKVFLDIYEQLRAVAPDAGDWPESRYLYVSRKSTFLSSMKELSWQEIYRIWHQYSDQSLNRLLHNLGLPAEPYQNVAQQVGLTDFERPITDPEHDESFQAWLNHPDTQSLFRVHLEEAKALFRDYLVQEEMFGADKVGVVDIGWKGTIQDNIVRAFAGEEGFPYVHGFYMGLLDSINKFDSGTSKHGFFADFRNFNYIENVIFKNGSVFEMCTTPNHGTTVGYERRDRQVVPILKSYEVEKENFRNYFEAVFTALHDYLQDYSKMRPFFGESSDVLKLYFMDQVRRYILYPSAQEAKAFLEYSHVESFGVSKVTTYEMSGSFVKELFSWPLHRAPHRVVALIRRQVWPEGVLKRSRIPLMNFLYDLFATRRNW